jgi:hypothetical protein
VDKGTLDAGTSFFLAVTNSWIHVFIFISLAYTCATSSSFSKIQTQ